MNSYDWLELSRLRGVDEEFREIIRDSLFIDAERRDRLCAALNHRIDGLQRIMDSHAKYTFVDNISMDVRENTAYHGKIF